MIGVLLNVKSAAQIQLLISYVVSNAGWTPKYDLRVSSSERTMQVTYFGLVKQSTGEDWSVTVYRLFSYHWLLVYSVMHALRITMHSENDVLSVQISVFI